MASGAIAVDEPRFGWGTTDGVETPADPRSLRVLVVDDSPIDRWLAGRILEGVGGFDVVYASDGVEALPMIACEPPDVVVTDLQMPGMDGLQLVGEVRRAWPLVPTVLMTAHGSAEIALAALRQGAASYVPKRRLAFDLAGTVRSVAAAVRSNRQQRALREFWTHTEFGFAVENDPALIPLVVDYVHRQLRAQGGRDETDLIRTGVALHEALSNAMYHGNLELDSSLREGGGDAYFRLGEERRRQLPYRERRVHVVVRLTADAGTFVVRDEGAGFDCAAELPDPTDLSQLERPYGRGLFLIRTFMDEVWHNGPGNEITMVHRGGAR